MQRTLSCRVDLPVNFRAADILAFHRRDAESVAERVEGRRLTKGILWHGLPARLRIDIGQHAADAALEVDVPASASAPHSPPEPATDAVTLDDTVCHMLGMRQDVESFERHCLDHPQVGRLIRGNPGLRVPQTAAPFEAASWAIIGQQISVTAAVSVRRRLILATGRRHSSGLRCYPDARQVLDSGEEALRGAGLSSTKTAALLSLARGEVEGTLPLSRWWIKPEPEAIRDALLAIRGIGPWTVDYTLLRGFNWLDGSLHGDVAVRRNLQRLLGATAPLGDRETARWLADFSPWRALVAAHLWAMGKQVP